MSTIRWTKLTGQFIIAEMSAHPAAGLSREATRLKEAFA